MVLDFKEKHRKERAYSKRGMGLKNGFICSIGHIVPFCSPMSWITGMTAGGSATAKNETHRESKGGNREDIEPVPQISSETPLFNFFLKISVCRGNNPYIHLGGARIAQPLKFTILNYPEQL